MGHPPHCRMKPPNFCRCFSVSPSSAEWDDSGFTRYHASTGEDEIMHLQQQRISSPDSFGLTDVNTSSKTPNTSVGRSGLFTSSERKTRSFPSPLTPGFRLLFKKILAERFSTSTEALSMKTNIKTNATEQ